MAAGHLWGYSSVGRAPALQAGGREFESHYLHLRVLKESPQYVKAYRYLENRIQKANIEKLKIKILTTIQAMIGSHKSKIYDQICRLITLY